MKNQLLAICVLWAATGVSAQQMQVRKEKKQLFISHQVQAKESLYSLGRVYHLKPAEIAAANQLKLTVGLVIGQELKIPLVKSNFIQEPVKSKTGLEPVYHRVEQGDNLYQLSRGYNNINQDLLKKWNGISDNRVKQGQAIVVGYIRYTPTPGMVNFNDEAAGSTVVEQTKEVQREAPSESYTVSAKAVTQPEKQESKKDFIQPAGSAGGEGYFASHFAVNGLGLKQVSLSGTASTFKSTSGWTDHKFYVLINEVPAETVVRVTANGRSVYAMVLESLPSLRENNGLVCRLSNAAASALGITDAKFAVEIMYAE